MDGAGAQVDLIWGKGSIQYQISSSKLLILENELTFKDYVLGLRKFLPNSPVSAVLITMEFAAWNWTDARRRGTWREAAQPRRER